MKKTELKYDILEIANKGNEEYRQKAQKRKETAEKIGYELWGIALVLTSIYALFNL